MKEEQENTIPEALSKTIDELKGRDQSKVEAIVEDKVKSDDVDELRRTISDLGNQIVKERLMKPNTTDLRGQIETLRQHLRQELAVNLYLTENLKDGTVDFNSLPLEDRKSFFKRIDDMV
jgi:hypothetical protein